MANPWFRMYSEFAHDPKVQMMPEVMQRRYVMLLCMRCSDFAVTERNALRNGEIAFHLRISDDELSQTKALFIEKGFIDEGWNLLNWEKRQFKSDHDATGAERQRKHRENERKKAEEIQEIDRNALRNAPVTPPEQNRTEQNRVDTSEPFGSVSMPECPTSLIVDSYHEILPELPTIRLMNDARKKSISKFWKFVLTSKRSDGTSRASTHDEAITWVKGYFERASSNDFLMGRIKKADGHETWACDIDFLMSEKGKKHVIEKTKAVA
jgi:hypothetical protein